MKTADATIRVADLWFVVYAELKQVDFAQEASRTDQKAVEVANMWFQTRLLKDDELRAAGIKTEPAAAGPEPVVCPYPRPAARPHRIRGDEPDRGLAVALTRSWSPRAPTRHSPRRRRSPTVGSPCRQRGSAQDARPRPSRMTAASATPRSAGWRSSRARCWSRCTWRSSSPTPGSRAPRSCDRSSASSPRTRSASLRRELAKKRAKP